MAYSFYKKISFFLALNFIGIIVLFAQDKAILNIPLKYDLTKRILLPTNLYKKIDETNGEFVLPRGFRDGIIKQIDIQPEQGFFEDYLQNKQISRDAFIEKLKYFKIDSVDLSRKPTRHILSVLVGVNGIGVREARFDANFNFDFTDDKAFVFDIEREKNEVQKKKLEDYEKIVLQHVYKGLVYDKPFYIAPKFKSKSFIYRKPIEQEHFLMIEQLSGLTGTLPLSPLIRLDVELPSVGRYSEENIKLFVRHQTADASEETSFYPLDTVRNGSHLFLFLGISKAFDALNIKHIKSNAKPFSSYGTTVGTNMKFFQRVDLYGNTLNLQTLKGKYILLDFWGSWCGPCIAAIPKLKTIYERFKDKLEIVAIAYDNPNDQNKVKDLVKTHKMNWKHILDSDRPNNRNSIIKTFHISSYPTQILIDPKGRIILRSGSDGFDKIVNILASSED